MARVPKRSTEPSATDLIEEAVHLLRRHPRELAGYYFGAAPFAVGLLYFWAFVTWFAPPDGEVAAGALVLAVLFGWMKAGQNRFAVRLLACRFGDTPPSWTSRQWLAETAAQLRLQASSLVVLPLSAVVGVPFGWAYAYYQSATVLPAAKEGGTAARRHLAWEQMQLWPKQNHWVLAILSGLWLMVLLNVAVTFYALPALATRWLGIQSVFALSGWSYWNTTYLALIAVLTHLAVDPLIKTCYLLRVFHGRARRTGVDLRLVLAREKSVGSRLAAGLPLLMLAAIFLTAPTGHAAGAVEPVAQVAVVQAAPERVLGPAIDRALDQPDFRWRLHPQPRPATKEKEGVIKGFVRATFAVIAQMARTVYRWIRDLRQWVVDLFPHSKETPDDPEAGKTGNRNPFDWMAALQLVAYVLLVAVAALLIFVAWKVWRHNRVSRPLPATPVPAGIPDLRDEQLEASRLPADGWLDLARQKIAAREWRLALRALFLATLARHAHEGRLALAKFKTNYDYENELRRRSPGQTVLVQEFRDRRGQFEEVWYGEVAASDERVRDWLRQMEVQP